MDKTDRETHDFMNVESFSQLPFIRPAPLKEKGIRLFGKDFVGGSSGGNNTIATTATDESLSGEGNPSSEDQSLKESDNGESNRKFECHYCCRNFPTSQALGGHQNAHKRERQHAKRAHLHSTAAMAHGGYYSYHRFGSAPPPPPPPVMAPIAFHHQSWNNNTTRNNAYGITNPRFYGSPTHQPINGSPLALWRIPSVQNPGVIDRGRSMHHHPLPLLVSDQELKQTSSVVSGSSNSHEARFVYESKPSIQDQVSLDLHL